MWRIVKNTKIFFAHHFFFQLQKSSYNYRREHITNAVGKTIYIKRPIISKQLVPNRYDSIEIKLHFNREKVHLQT